MILKVIDWLGRFITVREVSQYIANSLTVLHKAQLKQLEERKQEYIELGMSEKKAAVYALHELGFIDDPETVCRLAQIFS